MYTQTGNPYPEAPNGGQRRSCEPTNAHPSHRPPPRGVWLGGRGAIPSRHRRRSVLGHRDRHSRHMGASRGRARRRRVRRRAGGRQCPRLHWHVVRQVRMLPRTWRTGGVGLSPQRKRDDSGRSTTHLRGCRVNHIPQEVPCSRSAFISRSRSQRI